MKQTEKGDLMYKSQYQIIIQAIYASLGSFYFGYQMGVMNLSAKKISQVFMLEQYPNKYVIESLLQVLMPCGAMMGAIWCTFLTNNSSRRECIIGCFFCSQDSFLAFCIGRFLCGITTGLNSTLVPIYIKEISPISILGKTSSMFSFMMCLGRIFSYILCIELQEFTKKNKVDESKSEFWKIVFLFPIISCLARCVLTIFVYQLDTPIYYMENGEEKRLRNSIKQIYKTEYMESIYQQVELSLNLKKSNTKYWKDMIGDQYRQRVIVGIILILTQQLSGINAITFYSSQVFLTITNNSQQCSYFLTLLLGVILFFCSIVGGFISDNCNRKKLLIRGVQICFLSLLLISSFSFLNDKDPNHESIYINFIITCIFSFICSFGVTLGPIVWLYNSEILPEKGMTIINCFLWFGIILVVFFFPITIKCFGKAPIFLFFSTVCLLSYFFIQKYIIETKGLTEQQIEAEYLSVSVSNQTQQTSQKSIV